MGLFTRSIDIEGGIFFPEGYFATGRRPDIGRPLAEIYSLSDPDDPPHLWWLEEQEKLSRPIRWKDDYFRQCAEILAVGGACSDIAVMPHWVIVAYDKSGIAVCTVDYAPVLVADAMDDVSYWESTGLRLDR